MSGISLTRRSILRLFGSTAIAAAYASTAQAGPLDSIPVAPDARMLRSGSAVVTENGQAANLFVPQRAILTVDFAIEAGKELKLIVITGEQFRQISAGQKPTDRAKLSALVSGVSSQSVTLERGTYVVFFGISQSGNTALTYRTHYRNA
jgi:hypothetical protein